VLRAVPEEAVIKDHDFVGSTLPFAHQPGVWLAGQVGAADASDKSLAGDFDGQVREVFSRLGQTLEQADGTLADMVTMTVFITDGPLYSAAKGDLRR
jgi:enamine deaminase RidA (YjgF/YER057c/UK114 family)